MSAATAAKINSGVPITIRNVSKVFGEDTDTPFQALKNLKV